MSPATVWCSGSIKDGKGEREEGGRGRTGKGAPKILELPSTVNKSF